MCKSRAEGGARCQAHTRQAVSDQMASYATAVTPVNSDQAREAMAALEIEGAHLEAPSREEVDQWLNQTIQQVRFEPSLTESRRERIIRRLREAVGKALPSGATFHAWKNVMAEAWQRSRRKAAVFFLAGVLTFSGGCGFTGGADASSDQPTGTSTSQVEGYPEFGSKILPQPNVSSEVASRFGEKDALSAYTMGAQLVLDHQMDGDRIATELSDTKPSDFASTRALLTPERQKDWDTRLAAAEHDDNSYAAIVALEGVGVGKGDIVVSDPTTNKEYSGALRTDVNPSFNRKITSPKLSVDNDGRLMSTFTSSSDFRVKANKSNYLVPLSNKTTLWFKKIDGKWKIDGWRADWSQNSASATTRDKS